MKKLQPTTQYRKDYKRIRRNREKVKALTDVLKILEAGQPIPARYKPHMLLGQYKGCMECHIEGDFLLVWIDPDTDIIELVRLGSHAELFRR